MAKPKKIQTPASTDLSSVGIVPREAEVGPAVAPFQIGDIIQIVPADKEVKHPLIANVMIVHTIPPDGLKLVCYQPGRNGHPTKRVVDVSDAVVVGKAKLKFPSDKQLPAGERPAYDSPLDKI